MSRGSLTLLGTGSSFGVPVVGCSCGVCTSKDERNQRLRCAALIEYQGKKLLIDAGPDIRHQLLRAKVGAIDGLLLTHAHYDHIGGLDDLRVFTLQQPLHCLLSKNTLNEVQDRFPYIFKKVEAGNSLPVHFNFECFQADSGLFSLAGLEMEFFTFYQGKMPVNGFRFGDIAYLSDLNKPAKSLVEQLRGVKTLIVSALRYEPSPIHLSLEEARDFALEVGAEQAFMIHVAHDMEHSEASNFLPPNMNLAYDGQSIPFETDYE